MKSFFGKVGKWIKRHKLITIITSIVLVLAITLPCVWVSYYTTDKVGRPDRISEGIVPTAEDVKNAITYEHVVIFGVDGAGGYFGECDTPNFDMIFSEGNINYNGLAQYPTISAENWGAMMLGVTSQKHQINNTRASSLPRLGTKYPSFFKIHSKTHKDATYFSAVDWAAINYGIIENGIRGMTKKYAKNMVGKNADSADIAAKISSLVVERTKNYSDSITFMHFDGVDHAGHATGYGSQAFIDAIRVVDRNMGVVYNAYKEKGWLESTLFICVSDHGHTLTGGHGGESETEKCTMLAVAGGRGNIIKGTCGKYVTHDLASIVLYALGVEQPSHYEGGVPQHLFTTLEK